MAGSYFKNFPIIQYANVITRSITARVALSDGVMSNLSARAPLELRPGMRADVVAGRYYDDPGKTWLVLLAAEVTDPWWDWYLSDDDVIELAAQRHGSVEEAERRIRHYALAWPSGTDQVITTSAWNALTEGERKYWEPVYGSGAAVVGYKLRREDWRVTTNIVYGVEIEDPVGEFTPGERAQFFDGELAVGNCHVAFANTTLVQVQHVAGDVETPELVLRGATSNASATLVESSVIQYVVPVDEQSYWAPVSEYDFIVEENAKKKLVMLLEQRYGVQAQLELKKKLGS